MNKMNQKLASPIWKIKFRMCKVKQQNFLLEKKERVSTLTWFKQRFKKSYKIQPVGVGGGSGGK